MLCNCQLILTLNWKRLSRSLYLCYLTFTIPQCFLLGVGCESSAVLAGSDGSGPSPFCYYHFSVSFKLKTSRQWVQPVATCCFILFIKTRASAATGSGSCCLREIFKSEVW